MAARNETAVLLLTCPDRPGLVARLSTFIHEHGGNILDLDEHVDPQERLFAVRIAWDMSGFDLNEASLSQAFLPVVDDLDATWEIRSMHRKTRVAVFVSKHLHCLHEVLWRHSMCEYPVEISMVISNHPDLQAMVEHYEIPFHHLPITPDNKLDQERREMELLVEHEIDTIVLARYMQILSPSFVAAYPNRIINIHHSFLPAFVGANPYKRAYERGVKIIGATSHYVTDDLDEGPIIEQDVIRVTHRDAVKDLIRKGSDLERMVLARALRLHFAHRILVKGHKTIIFE